MMKEMLSHIKNSLMESKTGLEKLLSSQETLLSINEAADKLIQTFEANGTVFSCGNGGSMCDAMHFAEELTGRYRKERRGFRAVAISDPGYITCVGNDFGYDEVFSRYLMSHGKKGDCLLAISTSGSSKNILKAISSAKSLGMSVIGLSGKLDAPVDRESDISICTPVGRYADRIQELHIKVLHIFIELIERHFCPENYIE